MVLYTSIFLDRFYSLSIIPLKFIQVFVSIGPSFYFGSFNFFIVSLSFHPCHGATIMVNSLFNHSCIEGHLGCFQICTIRNETPVNTLGSRILCDSSFISLG